jgi:hypothetical protein
MLIASWTFHTSASVFIVTVPCNIHLARVYLISVKWQLNLSSISCSQYVHCTLYMSIGGVDFCWENRMTNSNASQIPWRERALRTSLLTVCLCNMHIWAWYLCNKIILNFKFLLIHILAYVTWLSSCLFILYYFTPISGFRRTESHIRNPDSPLLAFVALYPLTFRSYLLLLSSG